MVPKDPNPLLFVVAEPNADAAGGAVPKAGVAAAAVPNVPNPLELPKLLLMLMEFLRNLKVWKDLEFQKYK
jgi:hypothetical protein